MATLGSVLTKTKARLGPRRLLLEWTTTTMNNRRRRRLVVTIIVDSNPGRRGPRPAFGLSETFPSFAMAWRRRPVLVTADADPKWPPWPEARIRPPHSSTPCIPPVHQRRISLTYTPLTCSVPPLLSPFHPHSPSSLIRPSSQRRDFSARVSPHSISQDLFFSISSIACSRQSYPSLIPSGSAFILLKLLVRNV